MPGKAGTFHARFAGAPRWAASVLVELWVSSLDAIEPLRLNVDRVFVRPVEEIFADDFELGELCRWTMN